MTEPGSCGAVSDARHPGDGFANRIRLRRVDSTNTWARRLVGATWSKGRPIPPVAITAREQTAGRGRQGRDWVSLPDLGLYCTVVWFPGAPSRLATLPLLVGIAVARGLREVGCEAGLKWPNDVLVDGRKIGGILIESLTRSGGDAAALLGFGVNHGHRRDQLPIEGSTSLALEVADPPALEALTEHLLNALSSELGHAGEHVYARDAYEALSVHRPGERLRCRVGGETVAGAFLGFDARGFLRLEVAGRV